MTVTTDEWVRRSAAARLLEVAMRMMESPGWKEPEPDAKYPTPRFRTDATAVEAAYRACEQAHELLLQKESPA